MYRAPFHGRLKNGRLSCWTKLVLFVPICTDKNITEMNLEVVL